MKKLNFLLTLLFVSFASHHAYAKWEQIKTLPATHTVYVAPNGNIICTDFQFDFSGGIYYSEDQGETWNKADVEDYAYNGIIEAGEYIFASGEYCHIARSRDNGVTWELLNYAYMLTDVIEEKAVDGDMAYAIAYYNDKLFIADINGGGAMYSEDFGETWTFTDRESLMYNTGYGLAIDTFYDFNINDGRLLLFGAYFVYRLNEDNYTWELLRNDSNFMGVTADCNGNLVCGRSIMNENPSSPFLEYTADGGSTWNVVPRPYGVIDNNIRAMHAYGNNLITCTMSKGIYYTNDMGENWTNISEGLPYWENPDNSIRVYEIPIAMDSDDDYLYLAIYDEPNSGGGLSGVYRYSKSDLPTAGIDNTINNFDGVYNDDQYLYFNTAADVTIYNINGSVVMNANNRQQINIGNLQAGIYIYHVVIDNQTVCGKFIKQ